MKLYDLADFDITQIEIDEEESSIKINLAYSDAMKDMILAFGLKSIIREGLYSDDILAWNDNEDLSEDIVTRYDLFNRK